MLASITTSDAFSSVYQKAKPSCSKPATPGLAEKVNSAEKSLVFNGNLLKMVPTRSATPGVRMRLLWLGMVVPDKCHIFARWLISGGFEIECPGRGDGPACAEEGRKPAIASKSAALRIIRPQAMRHQRSVRNQRTNSRSFLVLRGQSASSSDKQNDHSITLNFSMHFNMHCSMRFLPPKLAGPPQLAQERGSARGPILQCYNVLQLEPT